MSLAAQGRTRGSAPALSFLGAALLPLLVSVTICAQPVSRGTHAPADKRIAARTEAQLQKALRAAPHSFAANHNLGEFYIQQGRLAAAIPYLEKAQQADPKHYANSYDLALAYVLTGDATKARAQIQRALQLSNTAELHALLGEVEEKAGDVAAAAAAYHQAAEIEPSEKHLLSLGNLLVKSSNYVEAIKFFDYGLQKFPRSSQLKVGLGIALYSQGQYDPAVRTLCEAADLDPSDHRPFLFLGEMYGVSVEMADEVIRRMAQFVEIHPENALAHYYYALNLWKGRWGAGREPDLATIEQLFKRALQLDPGFAQARFQLGSLYANQRKFTEAIEQLRQAVKLDPAMANAHYRLGQAYQQTGQRALAAQEFDIFQRLKEQHDNK
jgi:tetratricopeptide (TPR) repeat protein